MRPLPLHAEVQRLLHYDPASGEFTWRVDRSPQVRAGMRAGSVAKNGYRYINIGRKVMLAHRLVQAAREERQPHMSGMAKCQACAHTRPAVAPIGTHQLDCPSCGASKGYMVHSVLRGDERFVCYCGCDVFRISKAHGPYCVNCAAPADGWF